MSTPAKKEETYDTPKTATKRYVNKDDKECHDTPTKVRKGVDSCDRIDSTSVVCGQPHQPKHARKLCFQRDLSVAEGAPKAYDSKDSHHDGIKASKDHNGDISTVANDKNNTSCVDMFKKPIKPSGAHNSQKHQARPMLPNYDSIHVGMIINCENRKFQITTWTRDAAHGVNGSVAFGTCTETNEEVAVKITNRWCGKLDLHEANVLRQLTTPSNTNIIRYYGHAIHDDMLFMVVEKMNSTLKQELQHNPEAGTLPYIKCVTRQLFSALDFLKSQGIVHSDLKMDNVMVQDPLIVKVIDFGSAKVVGRETNKLKPILQNQAPEILLGGPWGYPGDMWCLGVITLYLLAKSRFFQGRSIGQMLYSICHLFGPPKVALSNCPEFEKHFISDPDANCFNLLDKDLKRCPVTDLNMILEQHSDDPFGFEALVEVLEGIFDWNPETRLTPKNVLQLTFYQADADYVGDDESNEDSTSEDE